jgi:hypothetical protein
MRYLRKQVINRRAPYDQRLSVDINNAVVMTTTNNLTLPSGTTAQRPVAAITVNGMIRYNTTLDEIEVYQANNWRSLRFKEPALITQQSLGAGDSTNVYFGPLNPAPVLLAQSGGTWDLPQIAKNITVVVENVLQLAITNYTVVQDPPAPTETYTPTTSYISPEGTSTIYFNSHLLGTSASWSANTATLTFSSTPTLAQTPFAVGTTIVVTGFMPTAYNGTWTVTASSNSSVSFTLGSDPGVSTVAGQIKSSNAVYTSIDIIGASISGHANIQNGSTIISAISEPTTDALISVVISLPIQNGTLPSPQQLTISNSVQPPSGYYVKFSSPPPLGKVVTVLHGFDK